MHRAIRARSPPERACSIHIHKHTFTNPFERRNPMKIFYINNDGGGFADTIEVTESITVEQLFKQQLPDRVPGDFLIRVNRQPASRDQVLREGDRVTFTPTKIEGAA